VIVAVCADKGSPGVTTTATVVAMAWPEQRLLLEADPSGGDLAFRAQRRDGGGLLATEPGLLALAADARIGTAPEALPRYAQPTAWGVDVVIGPPSAHASAPMRNLWPAVASGAAAWPGTAIADLGRLYPGSPALTLAHKATAVLVLARLNVGSLYHLRDRVTELAHTIGDPSRDRNPVAVVVLARPHAAGEAVRQVTRMLEAVGCPIPVAGTIAVDPKTAQRLHHGQLPPRLERTDLFRSATELAATVCQWWPELAPRPAEVAGNADATGAADSSERAAAAPGGAR
jgi:hypothetical protein